MTGLGTVVRPGDIESIVLVEGGVLAYTDLFFCSSLAMGIQP